jgi:hypothetical protein
MEAIEIMTMHGFSLNSKDFECGIIPNVFSYGKEEGLSMLKFALANTDGSINLDACLAKVVDNSSCYDLSQVAIWVFYRQDNIMAIIGLVLLGFVERQFSELDLNNNGTISYTDFLAATIESHNGAVINEELIEDAFDKLTMEPNQTTIEPDDIQAVLLKSSSCSKNDPNNTKSSDVSEEAKHILEEVNPENGTVDYETFAAMFERNDEQNQSS